MNARHATCLYARRRSAWGIGPRIGAKLGEAVTEGKRPSVSLLMIVRNEERHLADCLRNVASLFDEIVIVDTGSEDDTRRIAGRFTPFVYDFPWCDDFSAARNEALRRSHGDWLFWLDADDRIEGENVERLRRLLASLDDERRMFLMNTACSSQFACEGQTLITHPRLFRRHTQLAWQGRVHEQLRPEANTLGYRFSWSDVVVRHLGYADGAAFKRKVNRDLRLLRMDYAVDPTHLPTLLHLGMAYFNAGRANESRYFLRQVIANTKQRCDHLRQVYCALATIEMHECKLNEALAVLDQGLAIFPTGEYLLYLRADCLYELDRYVEARATLLRLLNNPVEIQYRGSVPEGIREKLAPRKLADILRLQRQYASAEALFKSVLSRYPDDTLSWYLLGRVYFDVRQAAGLMQVVERLKYCAQGDIFSKLLLASWGLEQNDLGAARPLIDELIQAAPRMPLPRLLRLDLLERSHASVGERLEACRDMLRLQPGNPSVQRLASQLQTLQAHQQMQTTPPSPTWSSTVVLGPGLSAA
jgi:glycosyltransferase involved in cell wall biosynthesis